jgi:MSHA biogenesis protein MshN
MSLINQMLQDLDSRRAANGPGSSLPNEVRPLPAARRSHAPLLAGVGVAMSLLLGWFVWQGSGLPSDLQSDSRIARAPGAEAPVVQPSVPNPVLAPGLPQSPVASLTPEPAALAPALPAPSGAALIDDVTDLRLTTSLRLLPEREPVPTPRKATASSSASVVASPEAPPTTSASPAQAARAKGPMVIEKSLSAGSLHERAEGEYRKAISALNAGRTIEAIENLRASLKQEAAHTASRQLLIKLLVENKQLDEAAELLQDGLQLQPAQISWAMSLGRLQIDRGDLSGAWQTLQRSLPFAAGSADYQGFAAHVLQRLGRGKEAAEFYQSATRLVPAESRWWLGLGLALESEGRAVEAREAFLRAKAGGTLSGELATLVEQKLR